MDWFKKHVDTVIILTGIISSMLWMNGKFSDIEKDMAVIKTVLVMTKVMPVELAKHDEEKK